MKKVLPFLLAFMAMGIAVLVVGMVMRLDLRAELRRIVPTDLLGEDELPLDEIAGTLE